MSQDVTATLYFIAPFAPLWTAFVIAETRKALATIKGGRRHGR